MYSKGHKLGVSFPIEFENNGIAYYTIDITFYSRTHLTNKDCVSDEGVVSSMFVLFEELREQNNKST